MAHKLVKTESNHVAYIAGNMRQSDIDEIKAGLGVTPLKALEDSVRLSDVKITIMIDGKPAGIFGVGKSVMLSNAGVIWLLGTDELTKNKIEFFKASKKIIAKLLEYYPILRNFIDVRNEQTIKWLKACGFRLGKKIKLHDYEFIEFMIEKKDV